MQLAPCCDFRRLVNAAGSNGQHAAHKIVRGRLILPRRFWRGALLFIRRLIESPLRIFAQPSVAHAAVVPAPRAAALPEPGGLNQVVLPVAVFSSAPGNKLVSMRSVLFDLVLQTLRHAPSLQPAKRIGENFLLGNAMRGRAQTRTRRRRFKYFRCGHAKTATPT